MIQTETATKTINRIIMWVASVLLIGLVSFMCSKIDSQSKDLDNCKIDIARTQEQYKSISDRQNEILSQIKDISRKLDRHMEK